MPELPTVNLEKPKSTPLANGPAGLDPVSEPSFGNIVAKESNPRDFYVRDFKSEPVERRSDFTPMTWVMIVVAGIALGFAVALMLAGA